MMQRFMACLAIAGLATACSSGGSDGGASVSPGSTSGGETGTVQGLELPEKLSLLSAKGESAQGGSTKPAGFASKTGLSGTLAVGTSTLSKAFDEPDTDYSQDEADVYVYDPSMESLNLINEIVCYMSQTAASQMVNEGPYIALINEQRCRQGENDADGGQTGQSSGGDGVRFARWIIESERPDNDSPQTVRLWVPDPEAGGEEGMGPQHILVEIVATEGRSESRPFGSFAMNFKGVADGTAFGLGPEVETMRGMLATVDNDSGAPQFRFINLGGDALASGLQMGFGFEQAANVRLDDAAGTSGLAVTHSAESWTYEDEFGEQQGSQERTFAIAYDSDHFSSSRDDDGDGVGDELVCRARDEFDTRVWRYDLYHREDGEFRVRQVTGGERVELNSGFPFSFDSDGDGLADAHGWIGYHGLWTESDQSPEDGHAIQRYDYASDQTVDYTLRIAPGRLTRRSKHDDSLGAFVGDEFQYWGEHPTLGIFGEWLVTVDQNLDFQVTGALEWTEEGRIVLETIDDDGDPQTPEVAVAAGFAFEDREALWMWSDSLGGSVVYTHDAAALAEERRLKYFAEEHVSAGDATLFPPGTLERTLYCYDQCLKGGLSQADVDAAATAEELYHEYAGQPLTYTLSVVDGKVVLTDDSNGAVVSAAELSLEALGHDWGINTGEMLTEPLANPAEPWLVYDQAVSYRWETGPNPWNRMITATDLSGAAVDFDRPLEMAYVHSLANDANGDAEFDGKRFMLHYSGPGELGGFPWVQEGDSDRWYPGVTLADGVVLSDGGNEFVVKAREKEQSMRQVDSAQCSGLDAEAAYDDASLRLPEFADIGTVGFGLADRPVIDAAPAVIDGEVQ